MEEARSGSSAIVLIAGEAGVGKTRFLREIAADSRRAGVRVLEGGAIQLGAGGLPFGPIIEAFRALPDQLAPTQLDELLGRSRGELARVMPSAVRSTDPPAPDSSQGQTFEQILLFIHRLAAVRRSCSHSRTSTGRIRRPWTSSSSWFGTCATDRSP